MKIVSYMVRFTVVRDTGKRAVLLAFLKVSSVKLYLFKAILLQGKWLWQFFLLFQRSEVGCLYSLFYLLIGILLT